MVREESAGGDQTPAGILPWLLLLLLCRLLVLVSEFPALHRIDELYAGAAALELEAGRGLPLAEMAWDRYSGGSLLVIQIARTTFRLLGPSAFALKLVAISAATGTIALWLWLTRHLFGSRVMRFAAVLFALCPVEYAKLNWMAWGNHGESAFPSSLGLLALVLLLQRDGRLWGDQAALRPPATRLLLGFVCGAALAIALFLSYIAVVYVGVVCCVFVVLGRRALAGGVGAGLAGGVALGLLPWLWLNRALHFGGVAELSPVVLPRAGAFVVRVGELSLRDVRRYLAPHLGLPALLEAGYWLAVMIALVYAVWRTFRRARTRESVAGEVLLWLGPLLFLLLYGLTDFYVAPESTGIIAYRYLAPLTPFCIAALAALLGRLPRVGAGLALAALCIPNLAHTLMLLPKSSLEVFRASGSSHSAYGWHVYEAKDRDPVATVRILERIEPPEWRHAALHGASRTHVTVLWTTAAADSSPMQRIEAFAASLAGMTPPSAQAVFAERLGGLLAERWGYIDGAEFDRARELAERLAPGVGGPILRAAVESYGGSGTVPATEIRQRVIGLPPVLREYGFEGMGALSARGKRLNAEIPRPTLAADLAAFERGFGFALVFQCHAGWCELGSVAGHPTDRQIGMRRALAVLEPDDPRRLAARAARLGWEMR